MKNLKPSPTPCHFQSFKKRPMILLNQSAATSALVSAPSSSSVRFRLDNLGPQRGSRKKAKRKGRGISAGQGNSCGFGMRGQKSRSGPGVRKGFEGGQMPLYRRIPKLKGIAGGNGCWIFFFNDLFVWSVTFVGFLFEFLNLIAFVLDDIEC